MLREPSGLEDTLKETRQLGKNPRVLRKILPYLGRYPKALLFSFISIITAALAVLGVGTALRIFVDYGFSETIPLGLAGALGALFIVVVIMALASYGRLYWVSQLSERVIADLRKDIFSHLLQQNVSFFESISLGEIQSRLTTDTTLLQIVLGTSIPIALRNVLIILGGIVMLMITSPLLTALIAVIIPLVLIPLLLYGR